MKNGDYVELPVRLHEGNKLLEKIIVVKGILQQAPPWAKPNEIAIATGNQEFPVAIVAREMIVEPTSVGQSAASVRSPVERSRTFNVESKEKTYTVTRSPKGKYSCTCVGFSFRQMCKHITAVEQKISEK